MPCPAFTRAALGAAVALALPLAPAQAQNTTSYVSRSGDDNNSCYNRSNACRHLQRAHDATAAGGRIVVVDSGNFLAIPQFTITKSISVVAVGVQAILESQAQSRISVDAPANAVVYLDGLHLLETDRRFFFDGIRFNSGAQLHVRNCSIHGFRGQGIQIDAPGSSEVVISSCRIYDNGFGVWARKGGGNGPLGVLIDNTTLTANRHAIYADKAGTHVRINGSKIVRNTGYGLLPVNNARMISYGNNVIARNGTNGQPTHSAKLK